MESWKVLSTVVGRNCLAQYNRSSQGLFNNATLCRETYHLEPAHRYVRQVPLHYSSICTPTCTTYYMLQISREGCGWRW